MKRLFWLGGLAALAVLSMGARPPGEFPMFLRLNGEPVWVATSQPGADGGILAVVDAGYGQVVKSVCHSAACICPGASCVCPSSTLSTLNSSAAGEKLAADAVHFMILQESTWQISVAPVSGSLMADGGAGAWCDHYLMK